MINKTISSAITRAIYLSVLAGLIVPLTTFAETKKIFANRALIYPDVTVSKSTVQNLAISDSRLGILSSMDVQAITSYSRLVLTDHNALSTKSVDNLVALTRSSNPCRKPTIKRLLRVSKQKLTCSPDYSIEVVADPYDNLLYGMGTTPAGINLPVDPAYSSGPNSIVAVIDSGVDYNHQDLKSNMWVNPFEIAGDGIDNDKNGLIDDVYGANFVANNGNPMDDQGHGTHVAGTIGAVRGNGVGLSGVMSPVKIMALKFISASTGTGSLSAAIQSLDYVVKMQKAFKANGKSSSNRIVASNNSWGGTGYYYSPLGIAIQQSIDEGVLFVAAAGNDNKSSETTYFLPANFPQEGIISVAAHDSNNVRASFSNYGATMVDVSAPGVNIASTYMGNAYKYMSGTSMAAPHVAGLAALIASKFPTLTPLQIKDIIIKSRKASTNWGTTAQTGGGIDATQALKLAATRVAPTPTPTPTVTPTPTATPTPKPSVSASPSPTATPKPSVSVTPTPSPSATPKPSVSASPSPTASPKPSVSVTPTPSPSATPKPSVSPKPSPTPNQPVYTSRNSWVTVHSLSYNYRTRASNVTCSARTFPQYIPIVGIPMEVINVSNNAVLRKASTNSSGLATTPLTVPRNATLACRIPPPLGSGISVNRVFIP